MLPCLRCNHMTLSPQFRATLRRRIVDRETFAPLGAVNAVNVEIGR